MTPSVPENLPVAVARPGYLPWYVHVPVMLLLMFVTLGLTVVFGIAFFATLISLAGAAICLAVAGKGNRLLFSGVLVVAGVLTAVALPFAFSSLPKLETEMTMALLICAMVPLWPALLLWLAHTLKTRRRKH